MNILVIDPSPLFLRAAYNFIDALPRCECVAAASLTEALDLAATREVDIILIDYSLRRRGADSAAHLLKALAPTARVLLVTPEDATAYRDSYLASEADGCLAKDTFGNDLVQLVAELAPESGKACA